MGRRVVRVGVLRVASGVGEKVHGGEGCTLNRHLSLSRGSDVQLCSQPQTSFLPLCVESCGMCRLLRSLEEGGMDTLEAPLRVPSLSLATVSLTASARLRGICTRQ